MKNKLLLVWTIPLLLLGVSCKKQENLIQDNLEKKIRNVDLIGNWTIVKTEITGPTKNGMTTVIDSSENTKLYVPNLSFSNEYMIMGSVKSSYKINTIDKQDLLVVESHGQIQNFDIMRKNNLLKLKFYDSNNIQLTTFYFKRKIQ